MNTANLSMGSDFVDIDAIDAVDTICGLIEDFRNQAFLRLSTSAKLARVAVELAYREGSPNPMPISHRWLVNHVGCARMTAAKALAELVDSGFLTVEAKRTGRGAALHRLTWLSSRKAD
ncbi:MULTISPECIES: hypothetical protein [unclassified Mesorhizobium]|uniref:hypothetical protein n=1 Tax=unclassified Mesorhizobium TaxID=325217 RepID=UPI00112BF259|nr:MULTISPECIES: hypothetical protein [unclassified Mesorhizobium]TPK90558.1 hypothetical protein FJ548_07300 [Mesorhizobium sp. B2-4-17]TPK98876.1 hypothetical protein FJ938_24740 [Mesorhizobium sp. B2-4-14]